MTRELEEAFADLGERLIDDADAIECSGTEYIAGLKLIEEMLRSRREDAAEEFGDEA